MTYSSLIFVWFLYAYWLREKRLDRPLNQRFFNDVFITYLQPSCVSQFTLQPTFFNDIFTTYLCMRGLSRVNCPRYGHLYSLKYKKYSHGSFWAEKIALIKLMNRKVNFVFFLWIEKNGVHLDYLSKYLFIPIGTNSSDKSSFFMQIFFVSEFKELLKFTQWWQAMNVCDLAQLQEIDKNNFLQNQLNCTGIIYI